MNNPITKLYISSNFQLNSLQQLLIYWFKLRLLWIILFQDFNNPILITSPIFELVNKANFLHGDARVGNFRRRQPPGQLTWMLLINELYVASLS